MFMGLPKFSNRFRKDMILSDFSGISDSVRICSNGSGRERGATQPMSEKKSTIKDKVDKGNPKGQ